MTTSTAATDLPSNVLDGMVISAKGIGPLREEHELITLSGPGLYEVVGPNTGGKSTLLRLMLLFHKDRLLRSDGDHVTDGFLEGYLFMKPAKLRFSVRPDGQPAAPERTDAGALPSITEIPNPIELLISGGHTKGEDARARLRLEQLLTFAPVESNVGLVERLAKCMDDRSFAGKIDSAMLAAWDVLLAQVASRKPRFKEIPFGTPDTVVEGVLAEARESILDDHDRMMKTLNALGNAARHAVEEQRTVVSSFDGRIEEAVRAAARRLGEEPSPELRHRLESWSGDRVEIDQRLEAARAAAAEVRTRHASALEEAARLELVKSTHGDRPKIASLEEAANRQSSHVDRVKGDLDTVTGTVTNLSERVAELREKSAASLAVARDRWSEYRGQVDSIHALLGCPSSPSEVTLPISDLQSGIDVKVGNSIRVTEALGAAFLVATTDRDQFRQLEGNLSDAEAQRESSFHDYKGVVKAKDEALEALRLGRESVTRWDETDAQLRQSSTPPDASLVTQADAAVEKVQGVIAMAEAAESFRLVVAEQASEKATLEWLETAGTDYREAARDSWSHLGAIVTDSLSLPWLTVAGLQIHLIYDKTTRRLATAETSADNREVRNLDDQGRISTAELHEAMLSLMLDRNDEGGIIILPWDYERPSAIAALDDARKARFATAVEERGIVIFAERPRRNNEPEGVTITKVEAKS